MAATTVPGACLCGGVQFEIDLPTLYCVHCHCSMCRRAHGAGYVTWIGVPCDRFRVVSGAAQLRRFRSSAHGTRGFCTTCGSTMFFESTEHPDFLDVALANVAGAIDRLPEFHAYFSDRAPWVQVDDDLPRFGGPSGLEPI